MSDDFWCGWQQRNVMEQAQARIAACDLSLRAYQAETRAEIDYLSQHGYPELARERQAVLEATTAHYLREMAAMQTAAEQQCAEIAARYDAEAIEREREDAERRQRWAERPSATTPYNPIPDWREGWTPAPASEARPPSDTPAPASPWAEPDLSMLGFGDDEAQGGGFFRGLMDWLR